MVETPSVIPPEWFNYIEMNINRAEYTLGISQLSTAGQKPAGLNSGKALIVHNDIESERHVLLGQRYEQLYLDSIDSLMRQAEQLEETKDVEIKVPNGDRMVRVKWSEIKTAREDYLIQAYPTSGFARNPAQKLEEISNLVNSGMLSPQEGLRLLDFPDVKDELDMKNCSRQDD